MTLYVLRYYPTLTETFVHDEIVALAGEGEAVCIAAFDAREPSGRPAPAPVYAQPHGRGWLGWLGALLVEWAAPRHGAPGVSGMGLPAGTALRVLWLAAVLRRLRPSGVHVHFAGEAAVWAMLACARAGVPCTVTVHAVDLFKPHPRLGEVLAAAAQVVTISDYNRRILLERYATVATVQRCQVAPAAESVREPGRLLFVGRNVPKKGLDALLAALAPGPDELPSFILDVVSDVPDPGIDGVRVHGTLSHEEVLTLMGRAAVFVLPCRQAPDGDMDGIPVVLLEAIAAGVAVMTTPISGIPEVVDETVGWLVPPDDVPALRAAIRSALSDPEEVVRRGQAGWLRARGSPRRKCRSA